MAASPGVTAVIPHWNRRDLLAELLPRLAAQTRPFDDVLVVDNGSTDGSAELAAQLGARVLPLPENAGFARAVNLGVAAARTDWVAVLNNDVSPEPDWLATLLDAALAAGAWFACGKLLAPGSPPLLDGTFDLLSRGATAWRAGHHRSDTGPYLEPRPIAFPPLTATLVRRELFTALGGLDEAFEFYLEDVEFGLRCALAARAGVYVPAAVAGHLGSATLGRWHPDTVRRIARNQVFLVARHYPPGWLLHHGWPVFVGQTLYVLVAARHGALAAALRGKWEGLRRFRRLRRPGPDPALLDRVLAASEAEIHALQRAGGYDLYWRLYFLFT